jgi:hypothetical protein
MNLVLSSGPARVIAAGEVTTFFGNDLTLQLRGESLEYTITLRFLTDASARGVAVRTPPSDAEAGHLVLELVNFDDDSGRGSAEPVLLGAFGEELLFLHFRAFRFGKTPDHTVHYTVFAASREAVDFRPAGAQEP